ncbi:hypothetical protein L218DRAFT_890874 [Marasmius fiardii PR-910]|nr:hypothetical protein L218DRAFT_890874 [Marasmius fiardii PR-910]
MNRSSLHWFVSLSVLLGFSLFISVLETKRSLLSTAQVFPETPSTRLDWETSLAQLLSQPEDVPSTPPEPALTAIIPVNSYGLPALHNSLSLLVSPSVRQVLLLCPESIAREVETSLKDLISSGNSANHATYSIISRSSSENLVASVCHTLSTQRFSTSNWILVTDEQGLEDIDPTSREQLLYPTSVNNPTGPRGIRLSSPENLCLSSSSSFQTASYLVPPFVLPTNIVHDLEGNPQTWQEFGEIVSSCLLGDYGGVVFPQSHPDVRENQDWCHFNSSRISSSQSLLSNDMVFRGIGCDEQEFSEDFSTVFVTIFSTLDELRLFAPVICSLQSRGEKVFNLLETSFEFSSGRMLTEPCTLSYESHTVMSIDIHSRLKPASTLLITVAELDYHLPGATNIRIPRNDLLHSSWMSSLTEAEWRDWHRPRLTVSVITKNRPASLSRLLSSVSKGIFFGDNIDVRIHLEQSADYETMQVVKRFSWSHGGLFVHHRIIHGGLLPAVTESWYPHTNDSYGLLLEDDVELSPLFYAWIKMSLLRYRYGESTGTHPNLFGISLYQQKNIELHPEGRRPFNASTLFLQNGLPEHTPYFSQIPCSWGAVYFPEHWIEFHDYLAIRFSEMAFGLDKIIVPDVRSNRWTKSWKKFFIELVFLRGYVMLYPNYPDYMSLSTNHLEVGSHVKVRSKAKQEAFSVPLMQLPTTNDKNKQLVKILDLPGGTLPISPPVLNLTGAISTIGALAAAGVLRRAELSTCAPDLSSLPFDARTLFCLA